MSKWDLDYLALARFWALRKSKDPSTKVGAVIVRPDKTIASLGYNGFPRGIDDSEERLWLRSEKYPRMVHAETNAILSAQEPLACHTLYTWPFAPCSNCAALIIQAGIARVVYSMEKEDIPSRERSSRWSEDNNLALSMLREAGVVELGLPIECTEEE